MLKQSKSKSFRQVKVLYGILAVLAITCLVLVFLLVQKNKNPAAEVSVGSMQYSFSGGKATKRNDKTVKSLQSFLEKQAAQSGCPADGPDREVVMLSTKDETQVLIDYGCYSGGSRMFVVRQGDGWKAISPTNHFDMLGIPGCEYIAENKISKEIAPVCVNETNDGPLTYHAR